MEVGREFPLTRPSRNDWSRTFVDSYHKGSLLTAQTELESLNPALPFQISQRLSSDTFGAHYTHASAPNYILAYAAFFFLRSLVTTSDMPGWAIGQ
jgi:hypothetical protein